MTTNTRSADLILEITERIVRAFHPEKIILFGSHARGDARADSDIDLLVVLSELTDKHRSTVDLLRLFSDLTVGVDIVVSTQKEITDHGAELGSVLRPALLEGQILYGG